MEESLAVRNLVPQRIVEVMDRSFRIYRDNFITFIGLTAAVVVPLSAISYFVSKSYSENILSYEENFFGQSQFRTNFEDAALVGFALTVFTIFIQYVVLNAMMTYITSENLLGRTATIAEAGSVMLRRLLHLTLAIILNIIVFSVTGAIIGVATVCIFPALLFPVWWYYLFAALTLLVPTIMLEDVGFIEGNIRGIVLSKTRFWRVLGFWIGMSLIMIVILTNFSVINLLIVRFVYSFDEFTLSTSTGARALSTVLSTTLSILVTPIMPIGLTVLYYDTRFREEGLDVALMAVESDAPRPSDVHSEPLSNELILGRDIRNVFLFVIGIIGLCGGFYGLVYILVALLS